MSLLRPALSASLALGLLAGSPVQASVGSGAGAAATPAAAAKRWWSAFDDPVLDGLVAAAGGANAAQGAALQAYIELRVAQARLQMTGQLQAVAAQQRTLLEQLPLQTPQRGPWLATVASRLQQWGVAQQQLQAEVGRAEATLSALTRIELPRLRQTLSVPEGQGAMPQVRQPLPAHNPAGAQDAGGPWQALNLAYEQAQRASRLVQASQLELRARELRQQAGADSALGVMEAYQSLVVDNDRYAAVAAQVALAWAQLLQSTGGMAELGKAAAAAERAGELAPAGGAAAD